MVELTRVITILSTRERYAIKNATGNMHLIIDVSYATNTHNAKARNTMRYFKKKIEPKKYISRQVLAVAKQKEAIVNVSDFLR